MAVLTSQQLAHYYDTYTTIDVTFTKPVAQATGLQSQDVFLRCLGQQLPCIVYSSSMVGAKVIASLSQAQFERLREAKNLVALRFCIKDPDKPHPLSFFVAARVTGYNPYGNQHFRSCFKSSRLLNVEHIWGVFGGGAWGCFGCILGGFLGDKRDRTD